MNAKDLKKKLARSQATTSPDEHLLVEMWESKNGEWEKLTREERLDILGQIGVGVGKLFEEGLQQVGFFVNDPKEPGSKHREHWSFVAVWKLPSKALLDKMLPQVDQLPKWFGVMHELRVWGRILDPITEGTEVLLNWGLPGPEKPVQTIEEKVTEILDLVRKGKGQDLHRQGGKGIQTMEENVTEILGLLRKSQGH